MAQTPLVSNHSARRNHLTLILAAMFAVLLGVIGWMEFGDKQTPVQENDAINRIVIKRSGHDDIELVRNNTGWQMNQPYAIVANTQRIEPLLSLGSARFEGYETEEVDMTAAGLITPSASVIIGTREFSLGNTDAQGERRYTLVDNKVSFVPEWVWSLIHGGATAFADLTVFHVLPETLYMSNGKTVWEQTNRDSWLELQADKIVPWPDDRTTSADSSLKRARFILSPSNTSTPTDSLAELVQFEKDTLINTLPGFAFAISTVRMQQLMQQ